MTPSSYALIGHRVYNHIFKSDIKVLHYGRKPSQFVPFKQIGKESAVLQFNSSAHPWMPYRVFEEGIVQTGPQKYYLYRHPAKMSSSFNGDIKVHQLNPGAFSIASHKRIYIMSVFGRNLIQLVRGKTRFKQPDPGTEVRKIVQVGWLNYDYFNSTLLCCLLLGNDSIVSFVNEKRMLWTQINKQPLMATKFFCNVPRVLYGVKVKGSSMSLPGEMCQGKKFMAVEFLNQKPEESIAVCAKISYGQVSAQRLIEWLEIQKYMGVDKVLMYFYNLNEEAMRVLLAYNRDGFVELLPFDYPDAGNKHLNP